MANLDKSKHSTIIFKIDLTNSRKKEMELKNLLQLKSSCIRDFSKNAKLRVKLELDKFNPTSKKKLGFSSKKKKKKLNMLNLKKKFLKAESRS